MAFDSKTRKRLAGLVGDCRDLLANEFDAQLQQFFGIYAREGRVLDLDRLPHLDDERLRIATLLRERIAHLTAGDVVGGIKAAVDRVLREQGFTVLNRFAALRMAEERGIIVEAVGAGFSSKGFKTFSEVAYSGLGDAYERYRSYLYCVFDELSIDLGVLFDRATAYGLLFPRHEALLRFFELVNSNDIKPLWTADETIGWVYQYFNDPEERTMMRDTKRTGSDVPRNSRELAVRNQFFTPRYVVEFLTDNTLGRIWHEMTQGESKLQERCRYLIRCPSEIFLKPSESVPEQSTPDNLAQEDQLRQVVHIRHRPLKDPRTVLMLDPACGSMHFGLYAFDLFEVIYNEAWELEEKLGADALSRRSGMKSLHDTYADKDTFVRDVPRLIIEHNLHGIDIDPRCAQIAGLSLWLRAQKAWRRLTPTERPAIKRSNIVCAESMPGEAELLREFVEREFPTQERPVFLRLLETIFDKMRLAGEAGSLLKIEEEIRKAIEEARQQWHVARQRPEFFDATQLGALDTRPGTQQELPVEDLAATPLTSEDFWEHAEERIYVALRGYAEEAENSGGFQRRLFAEDAARGFAFIDVCRKRYDVALMNPPFGEPTDSVARKIAERYPKHGGNMAVMFHDRVVSLLASGGQIGAVVDNTILVKSSYADFRDRFAVSQCRIREVCYLGWETLDGANVEVSLISAGQRGTAGFHMIEASASEREETLLRACRGITCGTVENSVLFFAPEKLARIPNYCISFSKETHLHAMGEKLGDVYASAKQGLMAVDTPRFTRLRWEIPSPDILLKWRAINLGGSYSPFYRDHSFVFNWWQDGAELKAKVLHNYPYLNDNWGWVVKNDSLYGKPGLAYGKRTDLLSVQIQNEDMLFGNEGFVIFPQRKEDIWFVLGFVNAPAVGNLLNTFCGQHKVSGYVDSIPVPPLSTEAKLRLEQIAQDGFESMRQSSLSAESSSLFSTVERATTGLSAGFAEVEAAIGRLQEHISDLQSKANAIVEESLGNVEKRVSKTLEVEAVKSDYVDKHISFWLGCAFGRWDIRFRTGEKLVAPLPEPFARIPVCPPGQLQNAEGLPAGSDEVPASYPIRIPWDGVLVDDSNHPMDVERRVREVIEIIFGTVGSMPKGGRVTAEVIEHEACQILGAKSLRDHFRKPAGFFSDHIKRYSKTRRQAPIYWPLSTASGSYTLWIYYHRLNDQTLFKCVNEFVKPKLAEVESDLTRLTAGGNSTGTRAELERLATLRAELVELRDELLRVAQLPYKPNLNDGVIITACPLWKLFRHPKWQKDLKACWQALEKGDYDWAHLAFTLWPGRVKDACKEDRSIALAHGLGELCTAKAPVHKAKKKKKDQMVLEDQVE